MHITWIYSTFKNWVQTFLLQQFQSNLDVEWNKKEPSLQNLEEWKQLLYQFVCKDSQRINISLIHLNPIATVR